MKSLHLSLAIVVAFLAFLSVPVALHADEGTDPAAAQTETQDKVEDPTADALTNVYGTGWTDTQSPASTLGLPTDPTGDINPPQLPAMQWKEFKEAVDALNEKLEKGEISAAEHYDEFTKLNKQYGKAQNSPATRLVQASRRRPVEAREIQVEAGGIPPRNPRPSHDW